MTRHLPLPALVPALVPTLVPSPTSGGDRARV
jgi:hypothetical protein